ncbi:50S ribosomal protein L33 [Natronospora cellulosivora (SeqCode)]
MREIVTLECTDCKSRNYSITKNKQQHRERMETKKYCKKCKKHTAHRETK